MGHIFFKQLPREVYSMKKSNEPQRLLQRKTIHDVTTEVDAMKNRPGSDYTFADMCASHTKRSECNCWRKKREELQQGDSVRANTSLPSQAVRGPGTTETTFLGK
jgi:hypothetical protein